MNHQSLVKHLLSKGYNARLDKAGESTLLKVKLSICNLDIELIHLCVAEFSSLPAFAFHKEEIPHQIAHVLPKQDISLICVHETDSVSVNFEVPELAIEESLKRHIGILESGLSDNKWNRSELLREFYSNWVQLCDISKPELICASADGELEEIEVYFPVKGKMYGYDSQWMAIGESVLELSEYSYIKQQIIKKRGIRCDTKGCIIPLEKIEPAPNDIQNLPQWYIDALSNLSETNKNIFKTKVAQWRTKNFFIVFNAITPSGKTWFGLHLKRKNKGKKTLPLLLENTKHWEIIPLRVKVFNKERLIPRSGASINLSKKSILLVGCGSVGGEIAYKLGAAGIGHLSICDPDFYSLDNLYRHVLDPELQGFNKANALSFKLKTKYPWIKSKSGNDKLLDLRKKELLSHFDLIIIAIGSPTHERIFHDYLVNNEVQTPVINTWLEGYGIGGHAILDIPDSKGCLRCAYVDNNTLTRGLSSNLNFIENNQDITVNHAGCGDLYLPYDAISASQTALIASNLAVQYLQGKVNESSQVSWKGDDTDAREKNISLTHRYSQFGLSLERLPLHNEYCDICSE